MEEISLMATTINQSIDYGKPRSSPNRFSNETGLTMQMEHEKCLEIVFHSNAQNEPTLIDSRASSPMQCNDWQPYWKPIRDSIIHLSPLV